MRQKTLKFMITFHSTSEAIAAERYLKAQGLPGRMIPVPREISASCGLAWCAPAEERAALEPFLQKFASEMDRTYEMEI